MGRRRQWLGLALLVVLGMGVAACSSTEAPLDEVEDYGIDGPFEPDGMLGKADSPHVRGPRVTVNTSATDVWTVTEAWENVDETPAARAPGVAWDADSGLNWDEKYSAWVDQMPKRGNTFDLTTPWGKSLPAPALECAELAIFLRASFAAWYGLPFFMTARDSTGTRVYFGHFGARTLWARYRNTPKFAQFYDDYSDWTETEIQARGWPTDQRLRNRGIGSTGDDLQPFLGSGARLGTYLDEIHLNKRVGHFLRFLLVYFGSVNVASSTNTYNLRPQALATGDILLHRRYRTGIGHTELVKEVRRRRRWFFRPNKVSVEVVYGNMPREQPRYLSRARSKFSFIVNNTGGEGLNADGRPFASIGGGLKRWRVAKEVNGAWVNTWMEDDADDWINDTDLAAIAARPARFREMLTPLNIRPLVLETIEARRAHLRRKPASCSARLGREEAFALLYDLSAEDSGATPDEVDAEHRTLEDYVFAELHYNQSKTCCWNGTTSDMYEIIMDYNRSLQQDQCVEPVVFRATDGGAYEVFAEYARQTGRADQWRAWSEDEPCRRQRDVDEDTISPSDMVPYCSLKD